MTDRYARVKPLGTHQDWVNFMIARFNDLDRISAALGKLTEDEQWNLDAICDALDQRIEERRI